MKNSQESKDVRQNDTYTKSRKHEANLRRNPTLHFQIGLILSLFVAILFIEMRMPTKALNGPSEATIQEEPLWLDDYKIEQKKVEKIVQKQKSTPQVQQPEKFDVKDDEDDIVEEVLKALEPNLSDAIPDDLIGNTEVVKEEEDIVVTINAVQYVPIFPGCEGLNSNQERKDCMSSKISKIVNKKFNTGLGDKLGLTGVNRIFVQFTINDQGVVSDMKARGPHIALENEAKRVVDLIPNMTPGRQGDKAVGVIYSLPITFMIED